MSQAVIDFCEGLKATLLGVEERLTNAKRSLDTGVSQAQSEARKHIEEAAEQLAAFRTRASRMAETLRAEFPEKSAGAQEKLKEFGLEAQVAMRHAVVFLAEAASKGAEGASEALKKSARQAHALAETLRHDTAVTVAEPEKPNASA